jgi:hypothetical protein
MIEPETSVASSLTVWRAITWRERVLFVEAWVLLVSARLICKVVPFGRIYKVAGQSAAFVADSDETQKIVQIRQAIDRASARVPRATCLTRGLAAVVLLRFARLPYRLEIGVLKGADGAFSAHAWVLSGENVVTGNLPDLSGYVPLPIGAPIPPLR